MNSQGMTARTGTISGQDLQTEADIQNMTIKWDCTLCTAARRWPVGNSVQGSTPIPPEQCQPWQAVVSK